jgi:hypothetical protein
MNHAPVSSIVHGGGKRRGDMILDSIAKSTLKGDDLAKFLKHLDDD